MKEVFLVSSENKAKAERLLKQDELVNRGSITLRECSALGIQESGSFIVLDCSETGLKRAEELLQGLAEKYSKREQVLEALRKQEEEAAEGFGAIMG